MKILFLSLTILGIGTIVIFLLLIYPNLQHSSEVIPQVVINPNDSTLDFSNSVSDNPLGIDAKVVYEVDTLVSCIKKCVMPPTPHLILSSQNGIWFVSYDICDGVSCKKDKINSPYVHLINIPKNYSGATGQEVSHINLQDLPWKIGDFVDIKVKAYPAEFTIDGQIIKYPKRIMTVDLGKSKIINATR